MNTKPAMMALSATAVHLKIDPAGLALLTAAKDCIENPNRMNLEAMSVQENTECISVRTTPNVDTFRAYTHRSVKVLKPIGYHGSSPIYAAFYRVRDESDYRLLIYSEEMPELAARVIRDQKHLARFVKHPKITASKGRYIGNCVFISYKSEGSDVDRMAVYIPSDANLVDFTEEELSKLGDLTTETMKEVAERASRTELFGGPGDTVS